MIINYPEVSVNGKKSGKCICGKRVARSRTFSQNISPFNTIVRRYIDEGKRPEDFIYDIENEIRSDLNKEKEEWLKEQCHHYQKEANTKEEREEFKELHSKGSARLTCGEVMENYWKK